MLKKIFILSLVLITGSIFAQDSIELGQGSTGNKNTYIDFRSDDTYPDFGFRVWRRDEGPNAETMFYHRGTGPLHCVLADNGRFQVSNSSASNLLVVNGPTGNVGIGVITPLAPLHINKAPGTIARFQSPQNGLIIISDDTTPSLTNSTNTVTVNATRLGNGDFTRLRLAGQGGIELASDANTVRAVITSAGNMGIGTTNPSDKLTVNGTIKAKEIKVTVDNYPDYVFADDYKLRTLDEVEAHIKEHKHLPGIPSAAEVERDGLALSDISKKQMEKIEELTLYMIELKKQNEELKKSNAHLLKRVEALELK